MMTSSGAAINASLDVGVIIIGTVTVVPGVEMNGDLGMTARKSARIDAGMAAMGGNIARRGANQVTIGRRRVPISDDDEIPCTSLFS